MTRDQPPPRTLTQSSPPCLLSWSTPTPRTAPRTTRTTRALSPFTSGRRVPRALRLRKCAEHEDCQLQKVDDGDWEHTPSKRTIGERLAPAKELERQLSDALSRVDDLRLMLKDIRRESGVALDRVRADIPDVRDLKAS